MEKKQLQLNREVMQCKQCKSIVKTRNKPIPGIGSCQAKTIIVGLAPGKDGADLTGIPFTRDPSGELINQMLSIAGLSRSQDVFITNLVKCNPKDSRGRNRVPSRSEIKNCLPYLRREIDLIKPRVVVPLGKAATEFLLDIEVGRMTEVHGKIKLKEGVLFFPFIHPGYVIRGAYNKEKYLNEFKSLGDVYRNLIKQEARLSRLDILLLLLKTCSQGMVRGKTKLQKLLFLVQHELKKRGYKSKYAFRPYLYGPYSREIYTDIDWLRMNGLIELKTNVNENIGFLTEFTITEKGRQKLIGLKQIPIFEEIGEIIKDIVGKYNKMGLAKLLEFVHEEFSEYHQTQKVRKKSLDMSIDDFVHKIQKDSNSKNRLYKKEI